MVMAHQPASYNRMSCRVLELIVRTLFSMEHDEAEDSEDKGKSHGLVGLFQVFNLLQTDCPCPLTL